MPVGLAEDNAVIDTDMRRHRYAASGLAGDPSD